MSSVEHLEVTLRRAWKPRPHLSVTEIAEKHLYLSPEYSKEAGYISFDRYSYLRDPINRLGASDPVKVVVFLIRSMYNYF